MEATGDTSIQSVHVQTKHRGAFESTLFAAKQKVLLHILSVYL